MHNSEAHAKWDHYLPLAGAAFTALMVLGTAAFPMPASGDVSPASDPGWLAAHHTAIIAQSYLRGLAAVAFIALSAAVAAAIRRATSEGSSLPGAALVGGAFTGGLLLLAQAITLSAALFVHRGGNPDTVRALGTLQDAFLNMSSLPAVLLFGATGIAALHTRLLPRWLTVLTLLGVPFALVDSLSYAGGPLEPVAILGLFYFLAWALLVGVRLYARSRSTLTDDERHASVPKAA